MDEEDETSLDAYNNALEHLDTEVIQQDVKRAYASSMRLEILARKEHLAPLALLVIESMPEACKNVLLMYDDNEVFGVFQRLYNMFIFEERVRQARHRPNNIDFRQDKNTVVLPGDRKYDLIVFLGSSALRARGHDALYIVEKP